MPIFCYEKEPGEIVERFFDVGEAPDEIIENGVKMRRVWSVQRISVPATTGWPITCYATGVNAKDAGELRDFLKAKGVPTEVTPDGDPIYRDHAHRRRALKARGFIDRAGYD